MVFALVSTVTVLSLFPVLSADNYLVLQGFAFDINADGKAVIHGYDDRSANPVIPQKLMGADVTLIDDYAFFSDEAIKSVSFSQADKLKTIGINAFNGCSGLKTLEIPSNIEKLSFGSFQNCASLESLVINGGMDEIPAQCFYGCGKLCNITIPQSVKSIGDRAFMNCESLSVFEIPDSVEYIAPNAFDGCESLVIYCKKENRARYFAEENKIPFVVTDGVMYTLGETNGDGIISISDVTAIQRHLVDAEHLDGLSLKAADVNQDGKTNISDATDLQMFLAKYELTNPIGEIIIE